MTLLAGISLLLALIPALLFRANLRFYQPPPQPTPASPFPAVSILIPARNEERGIVAAVEAALASEGVELEVLVLDDHSEDATAELVQTLAERDCRVRLEAAPPLPAGWCGKQHACSVLAQNARFPLLLFLDADVRLEPSGVARLIGFLENSKADLVSGVPRQETATFLEKMLIPLIHFVLLGFLPLRRMRARPTPAYAAGCGQLFLARRETYETVGGHSAIRTSLHDGLTLPRAFRAAGRMTDICDATPLADCRMYRGSGEVLPGLAKNATEGLARPGLILPATIILLGGQVLPMALLLAGPWLDSVEFALAASGVVLLYYPRWAGCRRFNQSLLGAFLHPLGILVLLGIQWFALLRTGLGRPAAWKGRIYQHPGNPPPLPARNNDRVG